MIGLSVFAECSNLQWRVPRCKGRLPRQCCSFFPFSPSQNQLGYLEDRSGHLVCRTSMCRTEILIWQCPRAFGLISYELSAGVNFWRKEKTYFVMRGSKAALPFQMGKCHRLREGEIDIKVYEGISVRMQCTTSLFRVGSTNLQWGGCSLDQD